MRFPFSLALFDKIFRKELSSLFQHLNLFFYLWEIMQKLPSLFLCVAPVLIWGPFPTLGQSGSLPPRSPQHPRHSCKPVPPAPPAQPLLLSRDALHPASWGFHRVFSRSSNLLHTLPLTSILSLESMFIAPILPNQNKNNCSRWRGILLVRTRWLCVTETHSSGQSKRVFVDRPPPRPGNPRVHLALE